LAEQIYTEEKNWL